MTLTLDLEMSLKVTAHPLTNGTLWVKYTPDLTKGREYKIQTRIFGYFCFDLNLRIRNLVKVTA